jgi:hypothetical protein
VGLGLLLRYQLVLCQRPWLLPAHCCTAMDLIVILLHGPHHTALRAVPQTRHQSPGMCVTLPALEPRPFVFAHSCSPGVFFVYRRVLSSSAYIQRAVGQGNSTCCSSLYLSTMARCYVGGLRENITERELEDEVRSQGWATVV